MPEIVKAQLCHVPFIAKTEAENFHAPWTPEQISDEILKENALFLVALLDEEPAGYISGDIVAGEVYINNIAVSEKFRRQGVGKALLSEFVSQLRDNDFITLEVRVSNAPARSLYEKLGFENLGERKNFYSCPTENACIYTLYLR